MTKLHATWSDLLNLFAIASFVVYLCAAIYYSLLACTSVAGIIYCNEVPSGVYLYSVVGNCVHLDTNLCNCR